MSWCLVIGRWSLVVLTITLCAELIAGEVRTIAGTGKKE